jgi:hypothetical protein
MPDMTKGEIKKLKSKARGLYIDIKRHMASVDCGLEFLCYVRPSVGRDVEEFRAVWAQLQEVDPDCPKEAPL